MQTFKAVAGARTGKSEYKFLCPQECDAVHIRGELTADAPFKVQVVTLDGELVPIGFAPEGQFHINRRFEGVTEFVISCKQTTSVHTNIEMSEVHAREVLDPTPVAIADETSIERQLRSEDFVRRELQRFSAAAEDATDDRDDLPLDEPEDPATEYQELDTIAEAERLSRLAEQTEAQAEADPAPEAPGPTGDVTPEEGQLQQETEAPQ